MSNIGWDKSRARAYDFRHHSSGGKLEVPRTPVQRILLQAKLKRLKAQFMDRQR